MGRSKKALGSRIWVSQPPQAIPPHLRSHGVGPRGKQFRDASRLEPVLRQAKGRPQPGTARSHDNGIVRVIDDLIVPRSLRR